MTSEHLDNLVKTDLLKAEPYDTGEFEAAMTRCMEKADWKGFEARRAASAAKGRLKVWLEVFI